MEAVIANGKPHQNNAISYIILCIFNGSIYITLIQLFISKKLTVFLCLLKQAVEGVS